MAPAATCISSRVRKISSICERNGWSADGNSSCLRRYRPDSESAIGQIDIEPPSDANLLLKNEFNNEHASVSPDGRWMSYRSSSPVEPEIYVERYPELGNRQQISTAGGRFPLWSRDGRELFFGDWTASCLRSLCDPGRRFVAGRPELLFDFPLGCCRLMGGRPYDVAPDGSFLVIRSGQATAAPARRRT